MSNLPSPPNLSGSAARRWLEAGVPPLAALLAGWACVLGQPALVAGAALVGWLAAQASLRELRTPPALLQAACVLLVSGALALAGDTATVILHPPETAFELLWTARPLAAMFVIAYLLAMLRPGAARPSPVAHLAWLLAPLLLNLALANVPARLLPVLDAVLNPQAAAVLTRGALWFVFNLLLLMMLGALLDRRLTRGVQVYALLLLAAVLAALAPFIGVLPQVLAPLVSPTVLAALAVPIAALLLAALWSQVYAASGLLLDALEGHRPRAARLRGHLHEGVLRGAVFGALLMIAMIALDRVLPAPPPAADTQASAVVHKLHLTASPDYAAAAMPARHYTAAPLLLGAMRLPLGEIHGGAQLLLADSLCALLSALIAAPLLAVLGSLPWSRRGGARALLRRCLHGLRASLWIGPLALLLILPRGDEWLQAARWLEGWSAMLLHAPLAQTLALWAVSAIALALLTWHRRARLLHPASVPTQPLRLANGLYTLELWPDGRGASFCEQGARPGPQTALTRAGGPGTALRGRLFYLQETGEHGEPLGERFSLAQEPLRYGVASLTQVAPDRLQLRRTQAGLRFEAHVQLAHEDAVECWDLDLHNTGEQTRRLDLCSFLEWNVPADGGRSRVVLMSEPPVLICRLGRRGGYAFHAASGASAFVGAQDARAEFLGPGDARRPDLALDTRGEEGMRERDDPCAALALRVDLAPGATQRLRWIVGYARTQRQLARLLARHLRVRVDLARLLALAEQPRAPQSMEDRSLRAFAQPWSADGRSLRAPMGARRPWTHLIATPSGQAVELASDGSIRAFAAGASPPQESAERCLLRDLDQGSVHSPLPLRNRSQTMAPGCEFGLGWANFQHDEGALHCRYEVYADPEHPVQVRVLGLRNDGPRSRRLRVLWALDVCGTPVLARDSQTVLLPGSESCEFFALDGPALRETRRLRVDGREADDEPLLLRTGAPQGESSEEGPACAAFCFELELAPGESLERVLVMGRGHTREHARELAQHHASRAAARAARERVVAFWSAQLGALHVQTPAPAFDRLVNLWLPYQLFVTQFARPQTVDARTLPALCWLDPPRARTRLIEAAMQARDTAQTLDLIHALRRYVEISGDRAVLGARLRLSFWQRPQLETLLRTRVLRVAQARAKSLQLEAADLPLLYALRNHSPLLRARGSKRALETLQDLARQTELRLLQTPLREDDATAQIAAALAGTLDPRRAGETLERLRDPALSTEAAALVQAWLACAQRLPVQGPPERAGRLRQRALALWFRASPLAHAGEAALSRYGLAPQHQPQSIREGSGDDGDGPLCWDLASAAAMLDAAYALLGLHADDARAQLAPGSWPLAVHGLRLRGAELHRG